MILMIPQRIIATIYFLRCRTTGSAVQHADMPPPQSTTLRLYLVVKKLLFISRITLMKKS